MSVSPPRHHPIPDTPPTEVLAAMDAAAGAHARLAAAGRELWLGLDSASGRLRATLVDADGDTVRALAPSAVLHVAAGGALA